LLAFVALVPAALAQQNAPHLAYVLPAGGQQGTTVQVKLGGQFLPNVTKVYVSGGGVAATVADYARPMNAMQATQLRDRMQELQKLPMDTAVRKEMLDLRVKLLTFNGARLTSPVLAETVTLQVAIAPGAEPGRRELRVATPQGLSNPLVFCVGQLPEFTETESIDVVLPGPNQPVNQVQINRPATNMSIALPATVNGRIKPGLPRLQAQARAGQPFTPGEADRYRFQARQGQQLVVAASARELMPYLADSGNEVAYCDDYRFHPDPVVHYVVPKDGEYTVEIKDALYRGREDFVYRITLGELPFVTGIFPLGGAAGAKTAVELTGWNLPSNKTAMDAKDKGPGIYPLAVRQQGRISNSEPFMVDTLPEAFEKEPNNSAASAQQVKLPIVMNGRVGRPGDWDVFRFQGRAGQEVVAEVYARRLDSPLDSVLRLTDAKGKQLAFNDDYEDKGAGLETHHADSRIMATLPAAGAYYLYLGDAQQKGGPEYAYRLRLGPPRPNFALRVTPSAINAGANMTVPITVHALRQDGFSGDIALALKDAPRGFTLTGGTLPAGQDEVRLTLTVPTQPLDDPISLNLEGRATIQGREAVRLAVSAEDMMQAFAYRHLVPATGLKVEIRRAVALRSPVRVGGEQPLQIPAGGEVRFQVQVPIPPNNVIGKVLYELSEPPEGIELRDSSPLQNGAEIVLHCDAAKAKPGLKGNLIVTVSAERKPVAGAASAPANRQRVQLGTLPAMPFEIVKR
jgi:hypothetical protein